MSAPERRQQLLDAAKAIVARDGFHSVSIEGVAREAGITRPIVYGHFSDLDGLLEALVDRERDRALAQLARVLPTELGQGDVADLLLEALRGYLDAVASDPATWRLVLMPQEGAPRRLHEHIARGRGAIIDRLARAVGPGLGPGAESPDPELTARMLSAVADEGARLLLSEPERYPIDRLIAHARWVLEHLPSGSVPPARPR